MRLHLQTLLPLFLPFAANSLLLCSLSAAIFLHVRRHVNRPWCFKAFDQLCQYLNSYSQKASQFSLLVESAPLLPFSCSRSEPRSRSGAPSDPSPSFYDGYPAETWGSQLCITNISIKINDRNHFGNKSWIPKMFLFPFTFSRTSKSTFSPSGIFGGIRLGIINVLKLKTIRLHTEFRGKLFITVIEHYWWHVISRFSSKEKVRTEKMDPVKINQKRTKFTFEATVLYLCMFTHLNFGLASSSVQKESELLKDVGNLCMLEKTYLGKKVPYLSRKSSQCL